MMAVTKTSSKNTLKKKLEEGRIRRSREMATADETDLYYKKPLVRYLITVFSDGSIKADKLRPEEQQPEEKVSE